MDVERAVTETSSVRGSVPRPAVMLDDCVERLLFDRPTSIEATGGP
jgi:hypothetical protein